MALPAIARFVVGLGFDFDNRGANDVQSSIDGIKSRALQLGAVLAGGFGIKALTKDFADATVSLDNFAKAMSLEPSDITALGAAIELEGGDADSITGQLERLQKLQDDLEVGNFGFVNLQKIGIDPNVIMDAENATEAYVNLADQIAALDDDRRRLAAAELGLDPASLALLSKGTDALRDIVEEQKKIRPITPEMVEAAKEFNEATVMLGRNLGAFSDKISTDILPPITDLINAINGFLDEDTIFEKKEVERDKRDLQKRLSLDLEPADKKRDLNRLRGPGAIISDDIERNYGTRRNFKMMMENLAPGKSGNADDILNKSSFGGGNTSGPSRPLQVNLMLDGQLLEQRIIDVNGRQNNEALRNLTSTTVS